MSQCIKEDINNGLYLLAGNRNSGKTSLLCDIANRLHKMMRVYVIDSATWHKDKSLLHKLNMENETDICIWSSYKKKSYKNVTKQTSKRIICFDVARDLEISHLIQERNKPSIYEAKKMAEIQRAKYRKLSSEILLFMLDTYTDNGCCILLDEIELDERIIRNSDLIKSKFNVKQGLIVSAMHNDVLSHERKMFYSDFSVINLPNYGRVWL